MMVLIIDLFSKANAAKAPCAISLCVASLDLSARRSRKYRGDK